jgi:ARID/BRIGHT DNA binding domain
MEEFNRSLRKFYESRNETLKIPQIGGNQLDLYVLYKEVVNRGGFQQVSSNKLWKEVVSALALPSSCTSASYNLRQHYFKILYSYEQEYFFKKSERSIPPTAGEYTTNKFTKKIRVTAPMMSNIRRMILAFESRCQTEVNWAINTLLLFSCNTVHNYILENNGLIDSLLNYLIYSIAHLPQFDEEIHVKRHRNIVGYDEISEYMRMEQVKSILLTLRNLSMIRQNEIILFKSSSLVETVVKLFNSIIDKEITQNSLELITNLAKHIFLQDLPNYKELLCTLIDCLQSSFAEQAIECIRKLTLPISNEEIIELLPQIFFNELAGWLVSYSPSKDSVLEILCTLSDQSLSTKVKIASAPNCLENLTKLLTSSSQTDEAEDKQAKMAAIILSNLSTAPNNCHRFLPYDGEIFIVAACDERISGILSNVLYEVQQLKK